MKISSAAFPTLIIAVTISLFTQLRVSFFGVGEILLLLVFLVAVTRPIKRDHLKKFIFTKFWLAYICLSILGGVVNLFFLESPTSTPRQMLFDLGAYVFVMIACFTFERMYFDKSLDIRKFLISLFYFSSGVLAALYLLSFFTQSLFGYTLSYYTHFAPLVVNVHQSSMYMVVLPFLGVLALSASTGTVKRVIAGLLIATSVAMSVSAATTKADMAIVLGVIVLAYGYSLRGVGRRYLVPVNVIYIVAIFGLILSLDVPSLFQSFFMEADPHGAREHLYSSSLAIIAGSPVVGHGPGPHVLHSGSYWDVHQTQLAILLQTGILGLIIYLLFVVKIVTRIWRNPLLLAAFTAIFVYSAGGDILRRLPIWVVLLLIYYWPTTIPNRMRMKKSESPFVRTSSPTT